MTANGEVTKDAPYLYEAPLAAAGPDIPEKSSSGVETIFLSQEVTVVADLPQQDDRG